MSGKRQMNSREDLYLRTSSFVLTMTLPLTWGEDNNIDGNNRRLDIMRKTLMSFRKNPVPFEHLSGDYSPERIEAEELTIDTNTLLLSAVIAYISGRESNNILAPSFVAELDGYKGLNWGLIVACVSDEIYIGTLLISQEGKNPPRDETDPILIREAKSPEFAVRTLVEHFMKNPSKLRFPDGIKLHRVKTKNGLQRLSDQSLRKL